MRVFISIFAIHHDARYYPEPEEFHPERFSQPIPSGAFLPFGDGKFLFLHFLNLLLHLPIHFYVYNFQVQENVSALVWQGFLLALV